MTDYWLNLISQESLSDKTRINVNLGYLFAGNSSTGVLGIQSTRGHVYTGGLSVGVIQQVARFCFVILKIKISRVNSRDIVAFHRAIKQLQKNPSCKSLTHTSAGGYNHS